MKRFLFLILLGVTSAAWASDPAATVSVVGPNTFQITFRSAVQAQPQKIWDVLTDYNHHADFLPHLSKSQIIGSTGSDLIVQQEGKIRVLFWTFIIHVTQQVSQTPPTEMKFHAIAGDFARLEGVWHVLPAEKGTALNCEFVVQPKKYVPEWAVRYTARRYLTSMVKVLQQRAEERRNEQ